MSYGVRQSFYKSKVWNDTRKTIWLKQHCLCAICKKPVYVSGISEYIPKEYRRIGIVHHIIHLDNNNVYDDSITLDDNNLIGICKDCHEKQHHKDISTRKGYTFDDYGNIVWEK